MKASIQLTESERKTEGCLTPRDIPATPIETENDIQVELINEEGLSSIIKV